MRGAIGATGALGADCVRRGAKADFDEILKPRPGDWPTYHGRLDGNRYSAHAQINTTNVGRLGVRWVYSLRGFDNETTPLVLDGVMYVSATNQVSALDAATGREMWRFSRPRTPGVRGDAGIGFNRGVAVLGSRVFLITDNAHLLAISRANGALLWEVVLPENLEQPYGGTRRRWSSEISLSLACLAATWGLEAFSPHIMSRRGIRPGVSGPCPRVESRAPKHGREMPISNRVAVRRGCRAATIQRPGRFSGRPEIRILTPTAADVKETTYIRIPVARARRANGQASLAFSIYPA